MTLQNKAELIQLYSKYSKVISEFFEINDNTLKAEVFCRKAITGSTYRSFHRLETNQADGMSKIFKSVANDFYSNNPTSDIQRDAFLAQLIKRSKGKFKNWSSDEAKELHDKESLMMLGGGAKGNEPLVFQDGGKTYRAFLEGRVKDNMYVLLLHLSNLELKGV